MTKYIIFGWSNESRCYVDNLLPADELLGTYHEISKDELPGEMDSHILDENGNVIQTEKSNHGVKILDRDVELAPYLFRGKTFPMKVMSSYMHDPEKGQAIIAYYEVPGT